MVPSSRDKKCRTPSDSIREQERRRQLSGLARLRAASRRCRNSSRRSAAERHRLRGDPAPLARPRQPAGGSAAEHRDDAGHPGDRTGHGRSRTTSTSSRRTNACASTSGSIVVERSPGRSSGARRSTCSSVRSPTPWLARGVRRAVGTGADGSAGLKRVKEYGGLVIVQDPDDRRVRRHAAQRDRHRPGRSRAAGQPDAGARFAPTTSGCGSRAVAGRCRPTPSPATSDALRDVLTLLRVRTGHDFSNYKPATVQRRVERRIDAARAATTSRPTPASCARIRTKPAR